MALCIGEKYGRWTVIGNSEKKNYSVCECQCGNIRDVRNDHLKEGRSQSCGCIKKEKHPWIYKGHPDRRQLNHIYGGMMARCYREKADAYPRYGGKGIIVCDEWKNSFDAFANWAYSNGYQKGLSLDRIDNEKGYSPSNCRFVTKREQQHNKSTNVVLMIDGTRYTATQAAWKSGINPQKIFRWLRRGVSKDEVISRLKAVKWDD